MSKERCGIREETANSHTTERVYRRRGNCRLGLRCKGHRCGNYLRSIRTPLISDRRSAFLRLLVCGTPFYFCFIGLLSAFWIVGSCRPDIHRFDTCSPFWRRPPTEMGRRARGEYPNRSSSKVFRQSFSRACAHDAAVILLPPSRLPLPRRLPALLLCALLRLHLCSFSCTF